ncbi:sulfotransferase family 2 domain-containing protein [Ruficoccus amylovorans]|uniref:Sulfotransferase family 2 domain-containing protein n=1 Tax=Ruficoccus amylovorans TaxID=1804625 RepID=A0A842HJ56_9BACT|nr:sulfotransferase family 2 domain-containing protein [Ruficoccus amylovorans]MBC2595616.1 sulfotransferase family 2 domain-containing protein [Ruficoccus amylovorans]
MAYHQEKQLLFIHIPKNAGKSIESSLDLIDGIPGKRSFPNRVAKFLLNKTQNQTLRKRVFGPYDYTLSGQHLTYSEIELLNIIPPAQRARAIKFAVVRNPYSRALSTYRHFKQNTDLDGFKRFWAEASAYAGQDHNILAHLRTQKRFLIDINGHLAIEEILRFESLEQDYTQFREKHQLQGKALKHIGAGGKINLQDFYDTEAQALIKTLFAEDFEQFGYQADLPAPFC